jgi:hypothetical protein
LLFGKVPRKSAPHLPHPCRTRGRLDCDASRPKLCRLYEGLGFRFHSQIEVGRYTLARYERAVPPKRESIA